MSQPSLETPRLILRPFCRGDAPVVQELAGNRAIADTTLSIPHPYEDGVAEAWIDAHQPGYESGSQATFAIVLADQTQLIGAIGLQIHPGAIEAELGYWVGKPYWSAGYATEATKALLTFGFENLRLDLIRARHFARNPGSGRVMQKAGMRLEETTPNGTTKWGIDEDLVNYSIRREDWGQR